MPNTLTAALGCATVLLGSTWPAAADPIVTTSCSLSLNNVLAGGTESCIYLGVSLTGGYTVTVTTGEVEFVWRCSEKTAVVATASSSSFSYNRTVPEACSATLTARVTPTTATAFAT